MAKVGNTDVATVIEESLDRYTETIDSAEHVEAWGTIGCLADLVEDGEAAIDWSIYGSKAPARGEVGTWMIACFRRGIQRQRTGGSDLANSPGGI